MVFFFSIIAADAVVRNVYYKYLHPKEALVSNGILNRFVLMFMLVLCLHLAEIHHYY